MSLQGHLRPSLPQKVLVKPGRSAAKPSSCLCPSLHKHQGSSECLGCFPSTQGLEACGQPHAGWTFFPEGAQPCPHLPSGIREHGILSMARKVMEQTGKDQLGS